MGTEDCPATDSQEPETHRKEPHHWNENPGPDDKDRAFAVADTIWGPSCMQGRGLLKSDRASGYIEVSF